MRRLWPYLRLRLRSVFRREAVSLEIRDELKAHIEQETLDLVKAGWSKRDARLEARRRFGNAEDVYERCSEQYMVKGRGEIFSLHDVKGGFRTLQSSPGFALTAILMIGLGIGATTTIFSVVDHVLLRPLPYPQPERLVTVGKGGSGIPIPDYLDIRNRTRCFDSMGAVWTREQDMTGLGSPERLNVGQLTRDFFSILGAGNVVGRLVADADFDPVVSRVAILSYGFWKRRLGSSSSAVGQTLTLEGTPYEIVGVLARDFAEPGVLTRDPVDVWIPLDLDTPLNRSAYVTRVVARLAPAVSPSAAQSELDVLAEVLANEYPDGNRRSDGTTILFPVRSLHEATVGDVSETLFLLMGAVGLMLLVACANVANLSLARGTDRAREMALRAALGASSRRLVRMLLTESLILGLLGGILGVVLSLLGVRAFTALGGGGIPRLDAVTTDWRIVGFAAALSIVTGILFGLLPAFRSASTDSFSALKEGVKTVTSGQTRMKTRDVLVVAEIGLALVLLVGAGLLFNSFLHLRSVDPGIDTDSVLTAEFRFGLPFGWGTTRYANQETKAHFTRELLASTRQTPGVISAGGSLSSPFSGGCCWNSTIIRSDELADSVPTWIRPVTHGYLETVGAKLITGRLLSAHDEQGGLFDDHMGADEGTSLSYVSAIVNRSLAQRLWPNESPLGSELTRGNLRARVVGVIEDISHVSLDRMDQYDLYVPFLPTATVFDRLDLAIRYRGRMKSVALAIRDAVWNIDPDLPVSTMLTMDQRMARSMNTPRFYSVLFAVFAGVAFVLAASGIYASMTYVVGQRRRELGIRLALGGKPLALLRMMMGRGALLTGLGVLIGLGCALALSRLLESFLFGITPTDLRTFLSVVALLGAVALLACYVPSRKAATADPMEVLKAE